MFIKLRKINLLIQGPVKRIIVNIIFYYLANKKTLISHSYYIFNGLGTLNIIIVYLFMYNKQEYLSKPSEFVFFT